MDASEIYSKRLNAKEVIFPQKGEFTFPIADGRIKTLGGDQALRTSTLIRPRPNRGEGHIDFLGESEGSFPQPHDSLPVAGEAINDFWSMSGNFIYRHHVEPRVKLYSPREESFPIPLKNIDVTRTTHTNLDLEKIPAWDKTKVRSKSEVIDEARTKGAKVHFSSLMDICHLKNAELETKHQKYKGRVVLRVDIVKDDSGSYAVFTEQGSSASQMTAATVMDSISRLPCCDGLAADAVSACTQVKMEDAHKLLNFPKSECPDIWIRLPRHKWPKSWSSMEDPVVPLERHLHGHPLAGLLWERQFEKILL